SSTTRIDWCCPTMCFPQYRDESATVDVAANAQCRRKCQHERSAFKRTTERCSSNPTQVDFYRNLFGRRAENPRVSTPLPSNPPSNPTAPSNPTQVDFYRNLFDRRAENPRACV